MEVINMLENRLKDVKSRIVAGIAALAVGAGLGGCISSHRVPVYGPNGQIHSNVSCYSLLHCTGDSVKRMGDLELDDNILYQTCYCYDPTPPRSQVGIGNEPRR